MLLRDEIARGLLALPVAMPLHYAPDICERYEIRAQDLVVYQAGEIAFDRKTGRQRDDHPGSRHERQLVAALAPARGVLADLIRALYHAVAETLVATRWPLIQYVGAHLEAYGDESVFPIDEVVQYGRAWEHQATAYHLAGMAVANVFLGRTFGDLALDRERATHANACDLYLDPLTARNAAIDFSRDRVLTRYSDDPWDSAPLDEWQAVTDAFLVDRAELENLATIAFAVERELDRIIEPFAEGQRDAYAHDARLRATSWFVGRLIAERQSPVSRGVQASACRLVQLLARGATSPDHVLRDWARCHDEAAQLVPVLRPAILLVARELRCRGRLHAEHVRRFVAGALPDSQRLAA